MALVCFSALLIHLSGGMTELHFHIFSALGVVIMLAEPIAVFVALLVVLVHHVAFFFFIPMSLINYQAGFGILVVHALFALGIGIPAIIVSKKFKLYIVSVKEIIGEIQVISGQVSESSNNILTASTTLSGSTTAEAAAVHQTAAALEELNVMISRNSESAAQTTQLSNETVESSSLGQRVMSKMSESLGEIQQNSSEMANFVNYNNTKLTEIVSLIGEIEAKTKVINDIVFQTKLLSFNASVEAARAGEHGKGFAVVAEEVGNLAQMSGNSAKEISSLLESSVIKVNSIILDAKNKVSAIVENGKLKIENGISTAAECRNVLTKIAENIEKMNSMASAIANACKEQTSGADEIAKAMNGIGVATQNNASVAQESSELAQKLSQGSNQLNGSVDRLVLATEKNIVRPQTASSLPEIEIERGLYGRIF